MIYKEFQGEKLSALGMGAMRLPVLGGEYERIEQSAVDQMVDAAIALSQDEIQKKPEKVVMDWVLQVIRQRNVNELPVSLQGTLQADRRFAFIEYQ